jgi:hypothetical protein
LNSGSLFLFAGQSHKNFVNGSFALDPVVHVFVAWSKSFGSVITHRSSDFLNVIL